MWLHYGLATDSQIFGKKHYTMCLIWWGMQQLWNNNAAAPTYESASQTRAKWCIKQSFADLKVQHEVHVYIWYMHRHRLVSVCVCVRVRTYNFKCSVNILNMSPLDSWKWWYKWLPKWDPSDFVWDVGRTNLFNGICPRKRQLLIENVPWQAPGTPLIPTVVQCSDVETESGWEMVAGIWC